MKICFLTGSQHLYGPETLKQVDANSREICGALDASSAVPLPLEFHGVLTTPEEIAQALSAASHDRDCAGILLWMHTFSPAKMWIRGLSAFAKPVAHLHTQFNRGLPWSSIDMDFMNLNQSAHGDREAGFMHTRMGLRRKVVVGHWSDGRVQGELGHWMRVARAWQDWQGGRVVRIGDNMRSVAVTEGNKVSAEMQFGFSINGYGVGDVVKHVDAVPDAAVDDLCAVYADTYSMSADLLPGGERHHSVRDAARIELGLRTFLQETDAMAFTTTFEDLHGLMQLPGIACQRLMADGYGFGAEGDWKTAALLRAMKVIGSDLPGGTSFMEDYTYDLSPGNEQVLGAHMLEICPSIAAGKPSLEVHPLGIGGKADPARLVFNAPAGDALNATLVDLGSRFRLLVNEVAAVEPPEPLPNLPVARALWRCHPDFATACGAWIEAGGAHHTGYSYAVKTSHLEDFAAIAGIEIAIIDPHTGLRNFRQDLRNNAVYYSLNQTWV